MAPRWPQEAPRGNASVVVAIVVVVAVVVAVVVVVAAVAVAAAAAVAAAVVAVAAAAAVVGSFYFPDSCSHWNSVCSCWTPRNYSCSCFGHYCFFAHCLEWSCSHDCLPPC